MNCCDDYGDCRQGRDCPARKCLRCYGIGYDSSGQRCACQSPARVAKVKSRVPRYPKAIKPTYWRTRLRHLAKWTLIAMALLMICAFVLAIAPRSKSMRAPCDLAEISPDITPQQRELCRNMRRLSV